MKAMNAFQRTGLLSFAMLLACCTALLGLASISLAEEGSWTTKADIPTARFSAGAAVVDGKIYVIGGSPVSMGSTAAVEEYDPAADTWTKLADMPTARAFLGVAAVNGIIYAIGGWSNYEFLSIVEAYDPAADEWTKKANMPTQRESYTVTVDGKIYAIGGLGWGPVALSTVEVYDPATDKWTRKAYMPTARWYSAACVVDGRIYVSGGVTKYPVGPPCLPTVEVYDPATDTWTQAADMPRSRFAHSASVVAGKMYIIGGADPEVHQPGAGFLTVDVYDPATDTWTTAADLPTVRGNHIAAVVDGKIYAIGGVTGPGTPSLSTVVEYDTGFVPTSVEVTSWGEIKVQFK